MQLEEKHFTTSAHIARGNNVFEILRLAEAADSRHIQTGGKNTSKTLYIASASTWSFSFQYGFNPNLTPISLRQADGYKCQT